MRVSDEIDTRISRRRFAAMAGGAFASFCVADGCSLHSETTDANDGRLLARPRTGVATSASGTRPLGLERDRDAILQVPSTAAAGPLPLLVLLHGAGGSGQGVLRRVGPAADTAGVAVLAPDSRGQTWDAIGDGFGRDVTFVDRVLAKVFDTVSVDPARVAVGGFSDGASYALSLGLVNGDLFPHVVAFSPGFIVRGATHGKPRVFISHGTADEILPIDVCGRAIAATLKSRGYDVTFREFQGGHQVPPDIATDAMRWMATLG